MCKSHDFQDWPYSDPGFVTWDRFSGFGMGGSSPVSLELCGSGVKFPQKKHALNNTLPAFPRGQDAPKGGTEWGGDL